MILKPERISEMNCFLCKGSMEPGTTAYMADIDDCYIIIKNVPCTKCSQCGEEFINGVTLQNIERIIEKLKSALTEIAIVDYLNAA
jgi:YgiT-type zinc finger domain-containing protein